MRQQKIYILTILEKVLVMVYRRQKRNKLKTRMRLLNLSIPSIRQGGNYKVWAWAKIINLKKAILELEMKTKLPKRLNTVELHFGTSSNIASFL